MKFKIRTNYYSKENII